MDKDASALAHYANYFRVGHTASEFIVDFCQLYGENERGTDGQHTVARVMLTPEGARELHALLGDSLARHARLLASRE
ncbi:hypothetical protein BWI17_06235 [Betaproteobacteria bacterium GR16-43]|nr:hypothetical protein BWI17_06235 [Betaproteobacteria bacterium GR16-43]